MLVHFYLIATAIAVALDTTSKDSICAAAKLVQDGEWNYYEGFTPGGVVGMFVLPYYWWHAGEAFGGLLDYYLFCDSENATLSLAIYDGMYAQAGAQYDYIPSNQSLTEGNDDQGVWGLATMEAVERNFTNPPNSWLSMTQAIYNTMNARWDNGTCGGGLRWQIFQWNSGYNYKNTIANGCLFNLASRLARYTGNQTYIDVAEVVWDWLEQVGFINYNDSSGTIQMYDGAHTTDNCTDFSTSKWSYTYGIVMSGCAYLYNHTNDDIWLNRTTAILKASLFFFNNTIMTETTCAPSRCNTDERTFRSLFARGLGTTSILVNSTNVEIGNLLKASAIAAAQLCSGGTDGITCGMNWSVKGWDGVYGLGEQMGALEVILANLVYQGMVPVPLTASTGGTSKSNPAAGLTTGPGGSGSTALPLNVITVKKLDKIGAGALTAVVLLIMLGGSWWMVV